MKHHIGIASGTFPDLDMWRAEFADRADMHEVNLARLQPRDGAANAAGAGRPHDLAALVVMLHRVDLKVLRALPGVRVIGRAGIGLDTIDLQAASDFGVAVTHQPTYATAEVADHASSMILAAARRLVPLNRSARLDWRDRHGLDTAPALGEQTLGVLGLGRIGEMVATRMRPFFKNVVGYDPAGTAVEGVELLNSIDDVLLRSHVLTLHLPLTEQTAQIIDASAIRGLPAGASLINVSRGGLIDEHAVAEALRAGHLASACLDVLTEEPPSANNPLLDAPNLMLTPHVAWVSKTSNERLARWTIESVLDYLDGRDVRHGRLAVDPTDLRLDGAQHRV